jgi:hypothetical protein
MDGDQKNLNLNSSSPGLSKKIIIMDSEARKRTVGPGGVQSQEGVKIQTKLIRLNDSWEIALFDVSRKKEN